MVQTLKKGIIAAHLTWDVDHHYPTSALLHLSVFLPLFDSVLYLAMKGSAPALPPYRRCRCGTVFLPDPDKEYTCSRECARNDALQALQSGNSDYRRRTELHQGLSEKSQRLVSQSRRVAVPPTIAPQAPGELDVPLPSPRVATTAFANDVAVPCEKEKLDAHVSLSEEYFVVAQETPTEEIVGTYARFSPPHTPARLPDVMIGPPSAASTMDVSGRSSEDSCFEGKYMEVKSRPPICATTTRAHLLLFPPSPSEDRVFVAAPPHPHIGGRTKYPPYGAVP